MYTYMYICIQVYIYIYIYILCKPVSSALCTFLDKLFLYIYQILKRFINTSISIYVVLHPIQYYENIDNKNNINNKKKNTKNSSNSLILCTEMTPLVRHQKYLLKEPEEL